MTSETAATEDDDADDERTPEMITTPLETDDALFVDGVDEVAGDVAPDDEASAFAPNASGRLINWLRLVTFGVLPAVALILFMGAGYLKWTDSTARDSQSAQVESVRAARDGTVALLSYTPADVDKQLSAAADLLTGEFRNSYLSLTKDVVIPGAKQQQIKAVATVPAASSVSASVDRAVALVFVNQTTTVGAGTPTDLSSAVRVTMVKTDGRWLISGFDPV